MDKRHFYHLCSDGKKGHNFIRNEADFIAALNIVALSAANCNIIIVAFTLEDTHFHFLLFGTERECTVFKDFFEIAYLRYACHTRGNGAEFCFDSKLLLIGDDENYLRSVAAYSIIQPTKDGKQIMPFDYPWGSGSLYFRKYHYTNIWSFDRAGNSLPSVPFCSLTVQQRREMIHSRKYTIPADWLVAGGIVLPTNYIDTVRFEAIFRTANCYRVYLAGNKKQEELILQRMAHDIGISLEDTEARTAAANACEALFGIRDTRNLNPGQRIVLAQTLRKQYRLSFRQLSEITHLPETEIRQYVP